MYTDIYGRSVCLRLLTVALVTAGTLLIYYVYRI